MYIRDMQGSDIAQVNAIELQSLSPWQISSLEQELLREHGVQYLLIDCDTIVAWVAYQIVGPEAELLKIAVIDQYRRRGLALYFLNEMNKMLRDMGVEEIFLEVRENNVPACSLYEKMGFEAIGKRQKYYQNPQDNALIYKLDIAQSGE